MENKTDNDILRLRQQTIHILSRGYRVRQTDICRINKELLKRFPMYPQLLIIYRPNIVFKPQLVNAGLITRPKVHTPRGARTTHRLRLKKNHNRLPFKKRFV